MSAALVYEWRRITSIRSTYVLAALFLVATGLVAYLVAQVTQGSFGDPGGDGGGAMIGSGSVPLGVVMIAGTNFLSAIFVTTIAAQSFGHEYRYGLIRLTLSEYPRRWLIFTAKLIVVVLWVVALYLLSMLVAFVVVKIAGVAIDPVTSETWLQLLRAGLFLIGYSILAFMLTLITRNLVLGVVIPLLLGAVVEPLASAGLVDRLPWLPQYLPISAGQTFLNGGDDLGRGGVVFLAWVVGLGVIGLVQFARRDA